MHDVQVVGEAASGEEALQLAERERPDVILMDIAMKGITGSRRPPGCANASQRCGW